MPSVTLEGRYQAYHTFHSSREMRIWGSSHWRDWRISSRMRLMDARHWLYSRSTESRAVYWGAYP